MGNSTRKSHRYSLNLLLLHAKVYTLRAKFLVPGLQSVAALHVHSLLCHREFVTWEHDLELLSHLYSFYHTGDDYMYLRILVLRKVAYDIKKYLNMSYFKKMVIEVPNVSIGLMKEMVPLVISPLLWDIGTTREMYAKEIAGVRRQGGIQCRR